ncbi:D-glycero-alpha-D-manno-heptose-1,7-bisphosphate 7-phosphatase [Egbenema bharatensis]|uniref:D-glycero-alpha-D-manno-heptose-1,7-bisphosphate 7-phosphatase n=1 Tax=Egbenema bharatensis TaxID=3463334 RepID=UPI003A8BE54A
MYSKAVFLDKDGTLIENVPYNVDPDQIQLCEGAIAGLKLLQAEDYRLIVITNQSGVARGYFPETALTAVEHRLQELLTPHRIQLDGFYYCPHHPDGTVASYAIDCSCRKPQPGLLARAAQEQTIDLGQSWLIGDILNDVEAGRTAGCRTILIDNGNETEWELTPARLPHHRVKNLHEAAQIILNSPARLPVPQSLLP